MPIDMSHRAFVVGAPLALAGCSGVSVWAPDDFIAAKSYSGTGPKSLTLYTMINTRSGSGAHSSVLVDASQRVMWDPAGTFGHATIPERNDVLFGFNPRVEDYYVSYHARETFYVVGQTIFVPDAMAEQALRMFMSNGAVASANCARATSAVLRRLPGFGAVPQTWSPIRLMRGFGRLPGVVTREVRENDADDKSIAAAQIDAAIKAGQ